jgi:hypothetical protein
MTPKSKLVFFKKNTHPGVLHLAPYIGSLLQNALAGIGGAGDGFGRRRCGNGRPPVHGQASAPRAQTTSLRQLPCPFPLRPRHHLGGSRHTEPLVLSPSRNRNKAPPVAAAAAVTKCRKAHGGQLRLRLRVFPIQAGLHGLEQCQIVSCVASIEERRRLPRQAVWVGFLLPPVPMCNGLPMAAAAELLCLESGAFRRLLTPPIAWAPRCTGAIPVPILDQKAVGNCFELEFFRCPLLSFSIFIFLSGALGSLHLGIR